MKKRIIVAIISLILGASVGIIVHEVMGQGKQLEARHLPQKHLSLEEKELPRGKHTQGEEKLLQRADLKLLTYETTKEQPTKKETKPETKQEEKRYTELVVNASAYISFCDTGCTGITATGTDVRETIYHDETGLKIIAVDPNIIPLGSIVEINGEKYIADDTGGAIKGHKIDILMGIHNPSKANEFGRKNINIKVYH